MDIQLADSLTMPNWTLVFAFLASVCLTVLKLGGWVANWLDRPKLEVVMTKELFYRLLDTVEYIYTNVIYVSKKKGALVNGISATLKKTDDPTREYKLNVAQIGEKYRTPDGLTQFSFNSTSPLTFAAADSPVRQVILFEHGQSAEKTRKIMRNFTNSLYRLKDRYSQLVATYPAESAELQAEVKSLGQELETLINAEQANLIDNISLSPGQYEFELRVSYRQGCRNKAATATSRLKYAVAEDAREVFRYRVREYLDEIARNIISPQENYIEPRAPEYTPIDIKEL